MFFLYWLSETSKTYQHVFKITEKLTSCSGTSREVNIEGNKTRWPVQG